MKNFLKKSFLMILLVAIVGCSDDDDTVFTQQEFTIAELVQLNPASFSSLLAALEKAELTATLNGSGTFTVFAPTNEAFDEYLGNLGVTLQDVDKDFLRQVLLNHVLGTEVFSTNISTGYVNNLADGPVENTSLSSYIRVENGTVKINNVANVLTGPGQIDVEATNGVIHVVDKVIPLPNLLTFVGADEDLSTLATIATPNQSIVDALSGEDNLTLLAPDNDAFAAIDLSGLNDDAIAQTLLNHVVAGTNLSTALSTGYVNSFATFGNTTDNLNLYINVDDGVLFNGISEATMPDIIASNGVIHKVNAVITLPTVVTFATADPTFSNLFTALTREPDFTFVSTLNTTSDSPAPFTVFAPTDAAFGNLLTELGAPDLASIPKDLLSQVLSYHVVIEANVRSTDLTDGQVVTTFETGSFTVNTMPNVTITDERERVSNIIVTDVQAANGIIHAVDTVLLPAEN